MTSPPNLATSPTNDRLPHPVGSFVAHKVGPWAKLQAHAYRVTREHLTLSDQTGEDGASVIRKALLLLILFLSCVTGSLRAETPNVLRLTLHDTVQPVSAAYLKRGLDAAAAQHASLVLISLGTPGGLLTSTREMVATIEQSPVPVCIYISPAGSRAGSAGFFLLEAADIAAMAPGTNAGAAHPIIEGGAKMDDVLKMKIENDAAAFLRSYTERRGRNTTVAEDAVRNSKSYSDTEALNQHLIEYVAQSDNDLLNQLDGKTIKRFDGTSTTLHLYGASITGFAPSVRERLLSKLTSPDVAVLLLVLGGLLIYLEFNVPGTIVPGAVGTLLVLLAAFGLNLLPIHHTAVILILAAAILMALESQFPSHGVVAFAGIVSLVIGLATLVDGPIPEQRVHLSTALAAGIGFGVISFALAALALKARRNKVSTGPQAMVGGLAVARTALQPTGQVEIRGELWQATLSPAGSHEATHVPAGTHLRVTSVDGLSLVVHPAE